MKLNQPFKTKIVGNVIVFDGNDYNLPLNQSRFRELIEFGEKLICQGKQVQVQNFLIINK